MKKTQVPVMMTSEVKKPLFNDSSSSDEDEVTQLKWNSDISASKSAKLAKIKSQATSLDPRFKLDEKFVDSDEEEEDERKEEGEGENLADDVKREKKKNLEILSEVLHKPVFSSEEVKKYAYAKGQKLAPSARASESSGLIARFDPSQPESVSKYEITRKVKSDDVTAQEKLLKEKEKKPAVSSERYYEVSCRLKDVFAKGEGETNATSDFKLSALFNHQETEASSSSSFDSYPKDKHGAPLSRENEKKYHRSQEREGEGEKNVRVEEGRHVQVEGHHNMKHFEKSGKVFKERNLLSEKFFLSVGDERLLEDPFFNLDLVRQFKEKNGKGKCKQEAMKALNKWKKCTRKQKTVAMKIADKMRHKSEKQRVKKQSKSS